MHVLNMLHSTVRAAGRKIYWHGPLDINAMIPKSAIKFCSIVQKGWTPLWEVSGLNLIWHKCEMNFRTQSVLFEVEGTQQ